MCWHNIRGSFKPTKPKKAVCSKQKLTSFLTQFNHRDPTSTLAFPIATLPTQPHHPVIFLQLFIHVWPCLRPPSRLGNTGTVCLALWMDHQLFKHIHIKVPKPPSCYFSLLSHLFMLKIWYRNKKSIETSLMMKYIDFDTLNSLTCLFIFLCKTPIFTVSAVYVAGALWILVL